MRLHQVDPIQDSRWAEFVKQHPKASIFHTVPWLKALRRTYGFEPVAFTTSPSAGALQNGIVFCRIKSWLTGSRLVSLPFSDHCEPLCDSPDDLCFLIRYLHTALEHEGWNYLELRPIEWDLSRRADGVEFRPAKSYFLHTRNILCDAGNHLGPVDRESVERAERAGICEKSGNSEELLKPFHKLFSDSRERRNLPAIPYAWFENLLDEFEDHAVQVRVAHQDGSPVAGLLTFRFKNITYCKYHCSDASSRGFDPVPWLLCRTIADAKKSGATELDLGRTADGDIPLLAGRNDESFAPQKLLYWKYPQGVAIRSVDWRVRIAKRILTHMPGRLQTLTGRMVCRHIG